MRSTTNNQTIGNIMNLKTHTAYPEIDITPHNIFTVKLIDGKGNIKFEDMGAGKDHKDARKRALTMVNKQQSKYLLGE